jgi:hypothetical protein
VRAGLTFSLSFRPLLDKMDISLLRFLSPASPRDSLDVSAGLRSHNPSDHRSQSSALRVPGLGAWPRRRAMRRPRLRLRACAHPQRGLQRRSYSCAGGYDVR